MNAMEQMREFGVDFGTKFFVLLWKYILGEHLTVSFIRIHFCNKSGLVKNRMLVSHINCQIYIVKFGLNIFIHFVNCNIHAYIKYTIQMGLERKLNAYMLHLPILSSLSAKDNLSE